GTETREETDEEIELEKDRRKESVPLSPFQEQLCAIADKYKQKIRLAASDVRASIEVRSEEEESLRKAHDETLAKIREKITAEKNAALSQLKLEKDGQLWELQQELLPVAQQNLKKAVQGTLQEMTLEEAESLLTPQQHKEIQGTIATRLTPEKM